VDLVVEPAGHADDPVGQPSGRHPARGVAETVLHGDNPTPDQAAGYWLAQDLGPVLRRLDGLGDDELRATLTRLCRRLLAEEGG
jgi:hypothetical protein